MKLIRKILGKEAIEKSKKRREKIDLILNGPDEYFMILNECPKDDKNETECPPVFKNDI